MLFEQFVQYVYGFYGKGGLWDMGVTREMIRQIKEKALSNIKKKLVSVVDVD